MGVIECEKHGRQSFYEVCQHIYEDFQNGELMSVYEMPLKVFICVECKNKIKPEELGSLTIEEILKLPEEEARKYELKFNSKYDNLKRNVICFECAMEVNFNKKIKSP